MENLPEIEERKINVFLKTMEKINKKMEELKISKKYFTKILKIYLENHS